ncbi:KIR protein [Plasmodium coatneyi]|uniref:KIR protein n=1 Tax=Plasmodium coatneyi TaxID=208452 RepID=A0A1B1DVR6_9APIC|nr:KIR protein [Plasmodium coatneyi]ANQ06862.1 KIR protein [Plasmodium coatneyi]
MSSETELFRDILPSKTGFYDKFDVGIKKCGDGCTDNVSGTLNSITNEGRRDKIKNAWYYVNYMYKDRDNAKTTAPCYFLYFWIGNKLSELPAEANFKGILFTICSLIKDIYGNPECKDICANIDEVTFKNRKILFDFWYDHPTVLTLLEHSGPKGITKCQSYLQDVSIAYEAVKVSCTNGGSYDYCKKFWNNHKSGIEEKLSKLKSELKSLQDSIAHEAQTAQSKLEDAVRSATTTSSITSIFGTLATIGTPFLLYKVRIQNLILKTPFPINLSSVQYKPWSSLFGKHSGNGRKNTRKKRTIGRNFGSSIEDTLTEYSTDYSTIDGTVSSAAHARPSTTGASAKGRAGGNNERGHRNNIGYQNM